MPHLYTALTDLLYDRPQLITADKLSAIAAFLESRVDQAFAAPKRTPDGDSDHPEPYCVAQSGERFAIGARPADRCSAMVAVVPVFGTIFQHAGLVVDFSGGTSTKELGVQLDAFDRDDQVGGILMEIHSPGGQIYGTAEVGARIAAIAARGKTKISAVANSLAASAALWIGAAAGDLAVTPGGAVGSLGVLTIHRDVSKAEEMAGMKTTLIAVPPKKIDGHPYAPLDDTVAETLAEETASAYSVFLSAMADFRGVTTSTAEAKFGGGGMLSAADAVDAGLADRVATFDDELARMLDAVAGDSSPTRGNRNRLALEAGR